MTESEHRPSLIRLFIRGVLLTLLFCMIAGAVSTVFAQPDAATTVPTEIAATEIHDLDEAPERASSVQSNTDSAPNEVTTASSPIDRAQAGEESPMSLRLLSLLGLFVYLGIAVLLSTNRRAINWKLVAIGMAIQLVFGILILQTQIGQSIFEFAGAFFTRILSFTGEGSKLLFGSGSFDGEMAPSLQTFAFQVLPTIIFFSSLMSILYHIGIMQKIVGVVALAMQKTMGTSGAETLSAAANIFVGQTEAPLMIKPYIGKMTMSELMAVMTGGFATVAGGVMASYVAFLQDQVPTIAQHLVAASVMSAPAALVIAKIMYPEEETPQTVDGAAASDESPYDNTIDAAAGGAAEGLKLALNVAAMLLAFVALVAMANYFVAYPSYVQHGVVLKSLVTDIHSAGIQIPAALHYCDITQVDVDGFLRRDCIDALVEIGPAHSSVSLWPTITLERILGWLFYPFAFVSGVPLQDVAHLSELYGQKTILNEFYAYLQLLGKINDPEIQLSTRTIVIASYGLCGFANLSSIAIQIGGIGGIAPERRSDLARIGVRAMIAGTLAAWMTGCVVGIFL